MEKVLNYIGNHIVSWMIEVVIFSIIAWCAISEIKKTAAQIQTMLSGVSEFSAEHSKGVGSAIDSVTEKLLKKGN